MEIKNIFFFMWKIDKNEKLWFFMYWNNFIYLFEGNQSKAYFNTSKMINKNLWKQ